MEIEQTIKMKPEEAKSVNSVYIFVIKLDGKPVKRWRKYQSSTSNFVTKTAFLVLDLRSSPGTMSCSSPEEELVASPDCSIICEDKDFFKLVSSGVDFYNNFSAISRLPVK